MIQRDQETKDIFYIFVLRIEQHHDLRPRFQATPRADSSTVAALQPSEPALKAAAIAQQVREFDSPLAAMEPGITNFYGHVQGSLRPSSTPTPVNPSSPTAAAIITHVATRPGQHGVSFRSRQDTPTHSTAKTPRSTIVPRARSPTPGRPQDPTQHRRRHLPTIKGALAPVNTPATTPVQRTHSYLHRIAPERNSGKLSERTECVVATYSTPTAGKRLAARAMASSHRGLPETKQRHRKFFPKAKLYCAHQHAGGATDDGPTRLLRAQGRLEERLVPSPQTKRARSSSAQRPSARRALSRDRAGGRGYTSGRPDAQWTIEPACSSRENVSRAPCPWRG